MNKEQKPSSLKATVLNWLGFRWTDSAQWLELYGGKNNAGVRVTPESALTLSVVWRCVQLISQTIATLPIGIYEKGKAGRIEVLTHPLARLISLKPSADMNAVSFWECMAASVLLRGNAWAEKKRIGSRIVALDFLHPDFVRPRRLVTGEWVYDITDERGKSREISESEIFHVAGFSTCGKFGMSSIRYGAEVFASALAANTAANSTFKNGLLPTTYFSLERVLRPEQREEFREGLQGLSGSLNAGKAPLLEGGMKAETIGINPVDAQLLESRNFSVEEVCRWFGVPPSMVGGGDKASSWASSSESLNLWFLQYGLRPILKRIEMAIWDQLITPAEQVQLYAEFSVEGLLRADTTGRTTFYSTALQNGWMSRNEVRALENLPPVEGGDLYTAQSNLLPLTQLGGAESDGAAARAALKHWLNLESP